MFDEAREIYRRIGEDFDTALRFHLACGYVFSTPSVFLMGRPVCLYAPHEDAWWVEYTSGSIVEAIVLIPFWLPYIAFKRKGRVKVYATATIVNKLLKDGPANTVSCGGRWGEADSTTETTITVNGSGESCEGQNP